MPIRIAPGDRLTLDVQLAPANPLHERIPDPDPEKYQGIIHKEDWKNPFLIVRADGIEVVGVTNGRGPITVDAVAEALESLPDSAWPYGLIVGVEDHDASASQADRSRIKANRESLNRLLDKLGVVDGF